jgi:DNA-binding NtrC family response regulator
VDDEPASRYGIRRALEAKYRVVEAESAATAREALRRDQPELVILDVVMPDEDGISFLEWMRQEEIELPVLMVSALDTAKTAVQALRLGAADYLVKGFELDELRQRVANLLKLTALEKENNTLRKHLAGEGQFGQMIGRTAEMRRAFEIADRVASTDSTVLILGESGTDGPGDSCAFDACSENVCGRELRRIAGDADRIGIIWLRAWRVYRSDASKKGEVRTGFGRHHFPG